MAVSLTCSVQNWSVHNTHFCNQHDLITEMDVMAGSTRLVRFEFKMGFRGMSHNATAPWGPDWTGLHLFDWHPWLSSDSYAKLKISDQTLVSLWLKNESYSTDMILGIYVENIVGHVCAKYLWVICHSFIFTVLLVGSLLVRRGLYISGRYISIVLPLA